VCGTVSGWTVAEPILVNFYPRQRCSKALMICTSEISQCYSTTVMHGTLCAHVGHTQNVKIS